MKIRVMFLLFLAALSSGTAFGHHAFSMFDQKKQVLLEGEIKEFQWANPHVWVQILVKGADGKVVDTREVDLNLTRKGQPVRIKAQKGVRYQLIDTDKPNDGAPDEVMTRRDGKNLQIALDDGSKADVLIHFEN